MELELGKLNDQKIKSTGGKTVKMGFSGKANAMLFDMFTDGIYSNPIGSVVREITSNCFDSHIEAGKDNPSNPVIVKHSYDKLANEHFISFIDNGVGMSPDRVENIYGVYFESTKRTTNDQIGGFGIGGKTPMAYTDTFNVITRYNGIEYTYVIYKGSESPEISLAFEQSTKECNGTEVRVPVKSNDLDRFESEIKKQLYYFENIVFIGFDSDTWLNSYNIYKGNNFLYRGDVYGDEVHLCIGKVAYPLNFSNLNLSRYDYRVPVGLKFEIGDIDVTPNREEVRYTDKTIAKIIEKLDAVKQELTEMIGKQYDNVQTIEEYYAAKENFGNLIFKDQKELYVGSWVKKSDVNYSNFKYNDLPYIPSSSEVLKYFYNVHEYGKTRGYTTKVQYGDDKDNVYYCKGEFQRKIIKQAYLNSEHDKKFIILKPYINLFSGDDSMEKHLHNVRLAFGTIKDNGSGQFGTPVYVDTTDKKKSIKLLKQFQKDVYNWVMSSFESYDDLEVPQDFIDSRKQERLSKEILNTTIPVTDIMYYSSKRRVSIKSMVEFKGRIFYAVNDDINKVQKGRDMFLALFGSNHIDKTTYRNKFENGKGVLFLTVAKGNLKYLQMLDNSYHIDLLYPIMLRRKMVNPVDIKTANEFTYKTNNLDGLFYHKQLGLVNKVAGDYLQVVKDEVAELKSYENYQSIDFSHPLISKYFDPTKGKAEVKIKSERQLQYLLDCQDKNKNLLKWVNMPYYIEDENLESTRNNGLVELLKKVMVF